MWITNKKYDELKEVESVNKSLKITINNLQDEKNEMAQELADTKDLRIKAESKNRELETLISEITKAVEINQYNNEENTINKIRNILSGKNVLDKIKKYISVASKQL
jgi:chromosome segregation ATPase